MVSVFFAKQSRIAVLFSFVNRSHGPRHGALSFAFAVLGSFAVSFRSVSLTGGSLFLTSASTESWKTKIDWGSTVALLPGGGGIVGGSFFVPWLGSLAFPICPPVVATITSSIAVP